MKSGKYLIFELLQISNMKKIVKSIKGENENLKSLKMTKINTIIRIIK